MKTLILILVSFQLTAQTTLKELLPSIQRENVREFLKLTYPEAKRVQQEYGVPIALCLAQSALETGFGSSRICLEQNNYFGVRRKHKYCSYPDMKASFTDYGGVLNQSCYQKLSPKDLDGWLAALRACGYFKSENYEKKINSIIYKYGFDLL